MARTKKESVALNINLDTNINDILTKYCETSGLTKTKAVEKAIEYYCSQNNLMHKNRNECSN